MSVMSVIPVLHPQREPRNLPIKKGTRAYRVDRDRKSLTSLTSLTGAHPGKLVMFQEELREKATPAGEDD
jgi:hypothetical protein